MSPILLGVAALLVLGASSTPKRKVGAISNGIGAPASSVNQFGLVGCDPYHTPSGKTSPKAIAGYATHPDYQWCYVVKDGDSAGSITEMFFGPAYGWRYTELIAANHPQKQIMGTTVSPDGSDNELNFNSLNAGEVLKLPRTWNDRIDQTGVPRAKVS